MSRGKLTRSRLFILLTDPTHRNSLNPLSRVTTRQHGRHCHVTAAQTSLSLTGCSRYANERRVEAKSSHSRVSDLADILARLSPNGTNVGLLKNQNVLKTNLKKYQICFHLESCHICSILGPTLTYLSENVHSCYVT